MIDDRLFEIIDPLLHAMGSTDEVGEEYREPLLDVLRYYRRGVRWSGIPVLGKGQSVVAVVRQPIDVDLSASSYTEFLTRLSRAVSSRFPPWKGLVVGLTVVVLTPEPIGPGDVDRRAVAREHGLLVLTAMRLRRRQERFKISIRIPAHHRARMEDVRHLDAAHEAVGARIGREERRRLIDVADGPQW